MEFLHPVCSRRTISSQCFHLRQLSEFMVFKSTNAMIYYLWTAACSGLLLVAEMQAHIVVSSDDADTADRPWI